MNAPVSLLQKRRFRQIDGSTKVTLINRAICRTATLACAIMFNLNAIVAASDSYLVADNSRANVDVFDTPATACKYWTIYRSISGLTLLGMSGAKTDLDTIKMRGLTFAAPHSAVTIDGKVKLKCPKVAFTGMTLYSDKTLSLLHVEMASKTPVTKGYVLPENVSAKR